MHRGTVAEIDLDALSRNLGVVRALAAHRPVIGVVKADAYGHGAVAVSRELARLRVEYLGVAFTEEARELRDAGITAPVIVFFDPDLRDVFRYGLIPVVSDRRAASALSDEAERRGRTLTIHVKIDTGMGRMGLTGDVDSEIAGIAALRGIRIGGIMSHFSEADLLDVSFAHHQITTFATLRQRLAAMGIEVPLYHIANSAAVMTLPESHFDAVRPGLMLYGYSPVERSLSLPESHKGNFSYTLRPVMTVKARLVALRRLPAGTPVSYGRTFVTARPSLIGVMSAGYADGYGRCFSNNAEVVVRGRRYPVVGRVCMDLTMIDLTGCDDVEEGDDVILLGHGGEEAVDAAGLAARARTIPYEVLTSIGSRARKRYRAGQDGTCGAAAEASPGAEQNKHR